MDNYAVILSQKLAKMGVHVGAQLPAIEVGDKITGIAPNGSTLQQITWAASSEASYHSAIVCMARDISLKYKDISCKTLMLPSGPEFKSETQIYDNVVMRVVSNEQFGTRFDILFQDNLAFLPVD